ncbi:MAG TPA: hypothetical protein ENF93_00495, partial [Ignisphaera sp.]|nr:hypothetical protein [Ignisphaera sp.]
IVIIHGGGSFGHYVVREHKDLTSLGAVSQTIWFMRELNMIIVDSLMAQGLPVIPLDTHAVFHKEDTELNALVELLWDIVSRGLIPVLYGDVIFCFRRNVEILSGDEIAWFIAKAMAPSRLIFATSVNGVYNKNPRNGNAILLEKLSISELDSIDLKDSSSIDVTGGMYTKLSLGKKYYSQGIKEVLILNGLMKNYIYRALCGYRVLCTKVVR